MLNRTLGGLFLMFLVSVYAPDAAHSTSNIEVVLGDGGPMAKVPVVQSGSIENMFSVPAVAEVLGYSWSWDRIAEMLSCSGPREVVITQDVSFCRVDGVEVSLAYPPMRDHADLFMHVDDLSRVFLSDDSIRIVNTSSTQGGDKPGTASAQPVAEKPEIPKKAEPVIAEKTTRAEAKKPTVAPDDFIPLEKTIRTVVLDPGHGGKDPGAVGADGTLEKDIVLAVGLAIRDILEKETDLRVFMTRDSDEFLSLKARTAFANKKEADLFISIHADAIPGSRKKKESIRGYKMYFLSQAKNEFDKLVAMRENSVVELEEETDQGDYLQNILIDMVGNQHLTESQDLSIALAETFGRELTETRKLHTGVGQAPYYVLNGAYMPSVLLEVGFVSNPEECKLLTKPDYQKKIAVAVKKAISGFQETMRVADER